VNDDCLKLTTYSSERDRTAEGAVTERLLALYAEREIQTSILLRGSEGFGRHAHLHTERLLSSSENPPAVTVAVDRRERVEALVPRVLEIKRRGLVTLERARLLTAPIEGAPALPEPLHEAAKLTVYLGRHEAPGFVAVTELLHRCGLAGATVLLGVDGTRGGRRARAALLSRNEDVPTVVIAVGPGMQIAGVLPELGRLLPTPRLTLERVRVCKRDGELLATPQELPAQDAQGRGIWQKLTVFGGHALAPRIVRGLKQSGAAGATALPGIWGFHGDHPPHGDRLLQLRRHVPAVMITVDTPERIGHSFSVIDELTREHGLVISEMVPAYAALAGAGGGLRLADHRY
jgi:PII-like signaling protein